MYFSAMLENAQDDLGKDRPNSTARQSLYQFALSASRSRPLFSCGVFWDLQDNARTVAYDRGMQILDFFRLERKPSCVPFGDLWFVASALRDEILSTLQRSAHAESAALVSPLGLGAVGSTGGATSYSFYGAPSVGVSSIPPGEVPTFDFSVDQHAHVHTGHDYEEDWGAPAGVSSCHSRLVTAVSGTDTIEEGWALELRSPASSMGAVIQDRLASLSSSRCFAVREIHTDETGGLDNSSQEGASSQRTSDSYERENFKQKNSGTLPVTPRGLRDASISNAIATCGRTAGGCPGLRGRSDVDILGAGLSYSSGQQEVGIGDIPPHNTTTGRPSNCLVVNNHPSGCRVVTSALVVLPCLCSTLFGVWYCVRSVVERRRCWNAPSCAIHGGMHRPSCVRHELCPIESIRL